MVQLVLAGDPTPSANMLLRGPASQLLVPPVLNPDEPR